MTTIETNKQLILTLLEQLGETPEQVAEALKAKGFKGRPKQAHCCPIYHYLTSHGLDVGVTPGQISLYAPNDDCDITAPLSIKQFVYDFDAGKYPDLEET